MIKAGLLLLALPLLAGCALFDRGRMAEEPERPGIVWRTELAGDVIEVELTDPNAHYRVERVELEAPDGDTYAASEITRETVRNGGYGYWPGGGVGVGVGGAFGSSGSSSVGIGLSFPLFGFGGGTRRSPEAAHTTARIPLPADAAYQEGAGEWSINVYLVDDAGEESVARIPAPKAG